MEENRLSRLMRISGPKREEITEERRKQQNEELHNLFSSPNSIREIKPRWTR
jgi:hypothetical protein